MRPWPHLWRSVRQRLTASKMSLAETTIGRCLEQRAGLTPGKKGVSDRACCYSWEQVWHISRALAVRYLKLGIRRGTHAAIWSLNSPQYLFCWLALELIGAVPVLVNASYKDKELADVLEDSDAEYLFYGSHQGDLHFQPVLDRLDLKRLPKLQKKLLLEPICPAEFEKGPEKEELDLLREAAGKVLPSHTACMLFTSGTTSRPKGVLLSHRSLVNNSLAMSLEMRWNQDDIMCIAVPLFHCFGITAGVLCGIHTGAELHLLRECRSMEIMERVQNYKCTVLNGVPTMFLALVRNPRKKDYCLDSLKSGIIAGSVITPEEYLEICRELHMEKLQPSYGQTESSPCITMAKWEDGLEQKARCGGKAIPDVEVCAPGSQDRPAEILTRGYHVMQGYYHRRQDTAMAIDRDGWLHTGDMGYIDKEGYLHITGRVKEMIIRGGENISPAEIEQCIASLPQALQVKAVGVKAQVLQEEIGACIVLKPGMKLTAAQVRSHVKKHLADYKAPKYVCFLPEFPLTSSGKICLERLRELAADSSQTEGDG